MSAVNKILKKFLVFSYKFGLRAFGGLGLHRVWPLGVIRDWLSETARAGKPESVIFHGYKIFLDPNDNLELSIWGENHPINPELKIIEQSIKSGDIAVDVGGNIGLVTLFLARQVGPTGKVFTFEPEPNNIALLRKNVLTNACENVIIVTKAVLDKSGRVDFFLSDFNVGDHRVYDPKEKIGGWAAKGAVYEKIISGSRKKIVVEGLSLDEFFHNAPRPDFIKIDVQGAEGGVIRGALHTLKSAPSVKILMEFWPAGMRMFGIDAGETLKMLAEGGFDFFDISKSKAADIQYLLSRYTIENNKSTNLFCVKK